MNRLAAHTRDQGFKPSLICPSDVSQALDLLGIDHVVRGDEATGLCPNPGHPDRRPSWSCNINSGLNKCLACGFGGSFVKLVSVVRHVPYGEAESWVRGLRVTQGVRIESDARLSGNPESEVRESSLWECGIPPASELEVRGVSVESSAACEILWNPRKECWVFPIRDPETGKLLGWQEKKGKRVRNRPVSVNKKESIFGLEHLKLLGRGPTVIVESSLDVGRFITAGWDRAVSTFGIEFSESQIRTVFHHADDVVFAADNDRAGQKKIASWLAHHREAWPRCKIFDYGTCFEDRRSGMFIHPKGDGQDPGDLSDEDLLWGAENATPAYRTCFEEFLT